MHRRARLVLVPLVALLAASCGGDDGVSTVGADTSGGTGTTDPTSTSTSASAGTIDWEDCGDGLECGTLTVPLDHAHPEAGTIDLALMRRPASSPDDRIGSLLVNPGGPGFGGTILAQYADNIYSDGLLDHFDIVGWDPRGTGESEPHIDCIDDYDPYFATGDITPDTPAERQELIDQAESFADACQQRSGELLPFVSTNASARDMDLIRQALGEDTISYFGFSYGSELGATWVTLFPDTVRAAVLDGAADPNADAVEGLVQQLAGFEGTLSTYLADCSADSRCAFHHDGDAEGAFDDLMASLDEQPIPTEPGRPDLTRSMANTAVAQAMYDPSLWPMLSQALAAAEEGDGSGLLQLYDAYYQRGPDGQYGNELEAFIAISCVDTSDRPTVEEADSYVPRYQAAAPRFAAGTTGDYTCTFWPAPADPRVDITGAGAGPVVVIGTTGDPATPFESTVRMADTLEDGRLIVVTADQHTGYGVNRCVNDAVDAYLIDLQAPPARLECP